MISNLNASSEAFIANMDRVQRSVENAGRQTSSGKRVNVASDAPGEVDTILQLRTDGARNTQIQENLSVAKADADAADGALTAATKIMDRARVLAAQGAKFTWMPPDGRASPAKHNRCWSKWSPSAGPQSRAATSSAATRTLSRPMTWISPQRTVFHDSPTLPPPAA